MVRARGPGLAKVRTLPTLKTKRIVLVAVTEWHVRDWLESADVVSEGNPDATGHYYGTTSIIITQAVLPAHEGLVTALLSDPHLRLRALRVAAREAASRGARGSIMAELSVKHEARGIIVTIDVEAKSSSGITSSPLTRERSC